MLPNVESATVDLAFCDPPFNIGYSYDVYKDNLPSDQYIDWCEDWMKQIHRVLKPSGTFWLMTGDWFASELDVTAKALGFIPRSKVIWYFTFGQNNKTGFTRSHTNIFYYVKSKKGYTFNADAIKVPSARQAIYGDKRAKGGGRVPDDTWLLYKHQFEPVINPEGDVWYNSRVAGTFRERVENASCQVAAPIMDRIVRACSNPGDLVLDCFCGSGATALAAIRHKCNFWTCDVSPDYIERIKDAVSREGSVELNGGAPVS